jgi:folate-binding protein YgfZ
VTGEQLSDEARADQEALRHSAGAVAVTRDVLRLSGPEATSYLQGQLSQDVEALAAGGSAWAFLLQPTGKVDTWLRVTRTAADSFVLDTDRGAGESMAARLKRFKLRTRFDLETLTWQCVALRGEAVAHLDLAEVAGDIVVARAPWPTVPALDLLGAEVQPPAGVRVCSEDALEALRIEEGVPAMGAELTSATIPGEAGRWAIDASVSFTKGCYTGQELVARIDSRGGNVPRPVRGLLVDGDAVPPPGTELHVASKVVGRVTSSAISLRFGRPVALAVVARSVEVGDVLQVATAPSSTARVSALPLGS